VRIDVIYERLSEKARARLDLFTVIFFVVYAGALVWVGTTMAVDVDDAGREHWHAVESADLAGQVRNPHRRAAAAAAGRCQPAARSRHRALRESRVMSIELLSFLYVAVFVAVLLTGLPLAFATGAVAVVFAVALFGWPGLTLVVGRVFTLMGNYVLVSVPLFVFMACVLERAGIAEAIFRAAHVWAGRIRGGLAVAVIISCALMAAMVGVIGARSSPWAWSRCRRCSRAATRRNWRLAASAPAAASRR
jgi:hypothetical protein